MNQAHSGIFGNRLYGEINQNTEFNCIHFLFWLNQQFNV